MLVVTSFPFREVKMHLVLGILLTLICGLSQAATPSVYSETKIDNKVYKIWAFNSYVPKCPKFYHLSVTTQGKTYLLNRKIQSCAGILTLKAEGNVITITVPSQDLSHKTFTYTYVFDRKSQLWTDRSKL